MNKKGTTMVEAALIFPLVILAVMAVIYIIIFLFQQVETQSEIHIALRKESGILSKTVAYRMKTDKKYPVYKKKKQVYFQGKLHFMERGILKSLDKSISACSYIIDEREFIRYLDLVRQKE